MLDFVENLLKQMNLEEKVGQMFLLAFSGRHLEQARFLLQEYGVGGCYISQDNAATPAEAVELSNGLQKAAQATRHQIPLWLGADQEGAWGVLVPHSATGPGNLALGATQNPEMTRQMYRVIGHELSAVGYNTLLAPCVDVNSDPRNPIIGTRSFGEFPAQVARMATAAVQGAYEGGVITAAKHFPGHGNTSDDSHRGLPRVDRARKELDEIDLLPFQAAIDAGVDVVMTAHILFPALDPDQPATLSAPILQDLLRDEMGFRGVVLSDSMNMGAMRKNYPPDESAVQAVLAGVDVLMLAEEHYDHDAATYLEKQLLCIRGVITATREGRIPTSRIDDAVRRVLTLKKKKGLFDAQPVTLEGAEIVGSANHRETELEAAASAVSLIHQQTELIPLQPSRRAVLVNATPRPSYAILGQTRGIGPNQTTPAFDIFAERLLAEHPDIQVFDHIESAAVPAALDQAEVILVVTENFPIPGVDFNTHDQKTLVKRLASVAGDRMAVIALRNPYELADIEGFDTYLCAFSSRPCAAQAAADVVLGKTSARGKSPVSIPETRS